MEIANPERGGPGRWSPMVHIILMGIHCFVELLYQFHEQKVFARFAVEKFRWPTSTVSLEHFAADSFETVRHGASTIGNRN